MELEARILAAFPAEPVPCEPLLEAAYLDPDAQGDEGATAYFLGRRWTELCVAGLCYHRVALYMFTPVCFAYYLPAFICACLAKSELSATIEGDLVFHLSRYRDPFWVARIRALSLPQRGVIADFLDNVGDPDDKQYADKAKEALFGLAGNS